MIVLLVTLDAELMRVCAVAKTAATTQSATAKWRVQHGGSALGCHGSSLPGLFRFLFADRLHGQETVL
jgi:hypothetical protein